MIQVRLNVFETNSSSTHNCTIMSDKDYQAFVKGEIYINRCYVSSTSKFTDNDYVTREQIIDIYENAKYEEDREYVNDLKLRVNNDDGSFDEYLDENGLTSEFVPYSYWGNDLETDKTIFTTEHGDLIHVLCEYGYDG